MGQAATRGRTREAVGPGGACTVRAAPAAPAPGGRSLRRAAEQWGVRPVPRGRGGQGAGEATLPPPPGRAAHPPLSRKPRHCPFSLPSLRPGRDQGRRRRLPPAPPHGGDRPVGPRARPLIPLPPLSLEWTHPYRSWWQLRDELKGSCPGGLGGAGKNADADEASEPGPDREGGGKEEGAARHKPGLGSAPSLLPRPMREGERRDLQKKDG